MHKRILTIGILFLLMFSIIIPISIGNNVTISNTKDKLSNPLNRGNILYVGGSGLGNYSSIQDAIDNASSGDTVFVYDDSSPYKENLLIGKTIDLIGENKETTLIEGNDDTDVIKISAEGTQVSGFSIRTTGVELDYSGINIYSNHTLISGNIIFDNGWGVKIYKNSYNQIIGNIFLNNNCGLYLRKGNNAIKNNQFFNDGISLHAIENIIENNTVNYKPILYLENQNNQIIDYECGQIILVNCNYMTVQNQRISKTQTGIMLYKCSNCKIIRNDVFESKTGIIVFEGFYNNLTHNDLFKNKNFGIGLYSSDYNIIQHNKLSKHTQGKYSYYGLYMEGCNNNTIWKNVVDRNNIGIKCSASDDNIISENYVKYNFFVGIKLSYNSLNNIITNNIIQDSNLGIFLEEVSFNKITKNNFFENDDDLIIEAIQYYSLRLKKLPYVSGNYWGRSRILPKFVRGKFTYIWMDVPWGGSIILNWIYIDWRPAKEPYDI